MITLSFTTQLQKQPVAEIHTHFNDNIPRGWPQGLFTAKESEILVLPAKDSPPHIHLGLGKRGTITAGKVRHAFLAAIRRALPLNQQNWLMQWSLPEEFLIPALTGATEGTYIFDTYKKPKERTSFKSFNLKIIINRGLLDTAKHAAKLVTAIAQGSKICRDLANAPGNALPPAKLAERLKESIKNIPALKIEILDTPRLRALRMGGILSVGGGSASTPRLITIQYKPAPPHKKASATAKNTIRRPVILAGKAITFDSGGISIKPAENMEEMKFDKAGGCAVAGALIAAAQLGIDREIIGIIPAAENLPSHTSYRPGDIITCHDGTTVEIINTDAEGRLILADALSYASRKYKPAAIIDLATLTGACVVALGTYRAGLFCENEKLKSSLLQSADTTGDLLWPLPHDELYYEQIKSKIATIKNTGGRWGGACTAAAFLSHFVPKAIPWAHIDIAGVAWNSSDSPSRPIGATGYGVALLLHWLMKNEKN